MPSGGAHRCERLVAYVSDRLHAVKWRNWCVWVCCDTRTPFDRAEIRFRRRGGLAAGKMVDCLALRAIPHGSTCKE